jgi:mono/diheme cytochrome c family protein
LREKLLGWTKATSKKHQGEMMRSSTARTIAAAAIATILVAQGAGRETMAQEAAKPESVPAVRDNYQRSLETYQFKKAANSGPERGREIFYYKCWFCHNEFTTHAPQLTGLFARGTLLSGLPVNNDTVKDRIRNGGEGMAAYKYTLSEADLDDLVAFVREKCCWDSDAPPANPRYRER